MKNQLEHLNVHPSNLNLKELMDKFDTQPEKYVRQYVDFTPSLVVTPLESLLESQKKGGQNCSCL